MKRRIDKWERRAGKRSTSLQEHDPERHTRPDKRSRSSNQPVLPLAGGNDDGDGDDDEEPPELESEAETVDYGDRNLDEADESDEDEENCYDTANSNLAYLHKLEKEWEKLRKDNGEDNKTVHNYLSEHGTQTGDAPIDSVESTMRPDCSAPHRAGCDPVAIELSREMSKLLQSYDGEELPPLYGEHDH